MGQYIRILLNSNMNCLAVLMIDKGDYKIAYEEIVIYLSCN
jgi:hypothetical protein